MLNKGKKPTATQGFTLVELSVVLVIIGLLVGGTLVGRSLYTASQIRASVSQIESFNSAYNAFLLKYNCLPGDCANGTEMGFASSVIVVADNTPQPSILDRFNPVSDANAFMVIPITVLVYNVPYIPNDPGYNPAPPQNLQTDPNGGNQDYKYDVEETLMAYSMLSQANMIKTVDIIRGITPFALDKVSPINYMQAFLLLTYVRPQAGSLASVAGNYYTVTATAIPGNAATATLSAEEAFIIDSKTDDGRPLEGGVRATGSNVLPLDITKGITHDVTDDGPDRCLTASQEYNVTLTDSKAINLCSLQVKAAI